MGRPSSPYTRVTEVASFVNSEWKSYWYKAIENGNKERNEPGLIALVAQECIEFSKVAHSADEWKSFLASRTAIREADRISKESTEFGKAVHAIVEAYLLGQSAPLTLDFSTKTKKNIHTITEREKFSGGLLVNWCKEAKVKPYILGGKPGIEVELKSETWKLTGHPDLVCTFGNSKELWLIDWKTSKEMRDEYKLQLSAYATIIKEQFGVDVKHGAIIRVPSDPNVTPQFEQHEVLALGKYWPAFVSCLDAMSFFKNKGRWKDVA